jgi:dCMP deaminase
VEVLKMTDESTARIGEKRPSWDDYFMEVAHAISKRATCDRGKSGCVIAKGRQLIVSGYVGAPSGFPHCDEVGHQIKKVTHENGEVTEHCMRTVHAEQNAVCQAAKLGVSISGATVYCRMTPCRTCAMLLINCGITRVVCERRYHFADESEEMFRQAGIHLDYKFDEVQEYPENE